MLHYVRFVPYFQRFVRLAVCIVIGAATAHVTSAQTTWYVDGAIGLNTNSGTSPSTPFKTITHALRFNVPLAAGDTVSIKASGRYDELNGEQFPLRARFDDLTLQGVPVGGQLPVISAVYLSGSTPISYGDAAAGSTGTWTTTPNSNTNFRDCIATRAGWLIDSLRIENAGYRKKSAAGWTNDRVSGIGVVNLPSNETVTISNCEVDDDWVGIRTEDTTSFVAAGSASGPRTVYVLDTLVANHGPVLGDPSSNDEGHQGILSDSIQTLTVDVQGSHLLHNHDGIESGNGNFGLATMKLTSTLVELCENGVEYGQGALVLVRCKFLRNGATGAAAGGVSAATAAVGVRGTPGGTSFPPSISCRRTEFIDNQIGVSIRGNVADMGAMDFGTTSSAGLNTFITAIQVPWNSTFLSWATPDNISYCGMVNEVTAFTVEAVGNTWRYETFGVSAQPNAPTGWNQGVASSGQFPSALTFGSASVAINFVSGLPQPRPTTVGTVDVTSTNNAPWNLSTDTNCFIHVK